MPVEGCVAVGTRVGVGLGVRVGLGVGLGVNVTVDVGVSVARNGTFTALQEMPAKASSITRIVSA